MPEVAVDVTGIREWSRIRDEVVPAFLRDFPGTIVDADERVVHSYTPDPEWRGAVLLVLGVEERTARFMSEALRWDYVCDVRVRELTDDEHARLREHRAERSVIVGDSQA